MAKEKTTQETNKNFIVTGVIKKAAHGASKYDEEIKNRISVFSEDTGFYDEITAYNEVGAKFTPDWFKKAEGYINLVSMYDIPVLDADGVRLSFETWIATNTAVGSKVSVKVNKFLKQGIEGVFKIVGTFVEE